MTDNPLVPTTTNPDLASVPFTYKTLIEISKTEFVPKELRGRPAAILACVMYGREWGLGPMQSLELVDMIEGRPSPAAQLLVAKVMEAGHLIYPKDVTPTSATAVGVRTLPDGSHHIQEFTFTMEDAARAGLAAKFNFKTYPGPMLYWRAATQLIRFMFPDVLGPSRAYSPDELGSETWVPPDPNIRGEVIELVQPIEVVEPEPEDGDLTYTGETDQAPFSEPAPTDSSGTASPPDGTEATPATEPVKGPIRQAIEAVQAIFPGAEVVPPTEEERAWQALTDAVECFVADVERGSVALIEQRIRGLVELMVACGQWKPLLRTSDGESRDTLHAALFAFGLKDEAYQRPLAHLSDLRVKADKLRFAHFLYEAARRRLKETTDD